MIVVRGVSVRPHRGRFLFAEGEVRAHWIVTANYAGFGLCDTAGNRLWAQTHPSVEVWRWKHSETVTDVEIIEAINQRVPLRIAA